jgi:hypothetical protein
MTREPIESSSIKSIGHDPATNTLEVEYHRTGVYQFHDVSADQHAAIMRASSAGTHLQKHIVPRHRATKQ